MPDSAKIIIEVVAGIVPGSPMPEYTRRWSLTRDQFDNDRNAVIKAYGESREYAATLENPAKVNWVRRDWTWL
jgi:hypothetical protein